MGPGIEFLTIAEPTVRSYVQNSARPVCVCVRTCVYGESHVYTRLKDSPNGDKINRTHDSPILGRAIFTTNVCYQRVGAYNSLLSA